MTTEYQIKYHTRNTYEDTVKEAIFELLTVPCSNENQELISLRFTNSLNEEVFSYTNLFGFQANRLRSNKNFKTFELNMTAIVEKSAPQGKHYAPTLEEELAELKSDHFFIDHHLFLQNSNYTEILPEEQFEILIYKEDKPVFDFLYELNQYVSNLLAFSADHTDVYTTANEVLKLKKGVCQDYAHVFLAMARKNGIPCRYVSGYLNQGLHLHGDSVMHAWVEAYIPQAGWHGFDPTNNLIANENHIKVAHGTDYSDCSPLRGIIKTTGLNLKQKTEYSVKVLPKEMAVAEVLS